VWDLAKAKMTCDGGDDAEDGLEEKESFDGKRKSTHGGCGYKQPLIRKDGLKLYAQFRANASDVSNPLVQM
jgi:DNA-directed RNA polymerase II subunit RPB1